MGDKIRWYHPFRALRTIVRNQEAILENQGRIIHALAFDRFTRRLRMHGVEVPPDVESKWHGRFEVCSRKLGDLRCKSPSLGIVPYKESYLYRFLTSGDDSLFELYRRDICIQSGTELEFSNDREEFLAFAERFQSEPYDISRCAIVILADGNVVVDGNHRVAALLKAHGEDYEVQVVKLFERLP